MLVRLLNGETDSKYDYLLEEVYFGIKYIIKQHKREPFNFAVITHSVNENGEVEGDINDSTLHFVDLDKISKLIAALISYASREKFQDLPLYSNAPNYDTPPLLEKGSTLTVLVHGIDMYIYSGIVNIIPKCFVNYASTKNFVIDILIPLIHWRWCDTNILPSGFYGTTKPYPLINEILIGCQELISKKIDRFRSIYSAYKECESRALYTILLPIITRDMYEAVDKTNTTNKFSYIMQDGQIQKSETPVDAQLILTKELMSCNLKEIIRGDIHIYPDYELGKLRLLAIDDIIKYIGQLFKNCRSCSEFMSCPMCCPSLAEEKRQECKEIYNLILYSDFTFGLIISDKEIMRENGDTVSDVRPLPYFRTKKESDDYMTSNMVICGADRTVICYFKAESIREMKQTYPALFKLLNKVNSNFKQKITEICKSMN